MSAAMARRCSSICFTLSFSMHIIGYSIALSEGTHFAAYPRHSADCPAQIVNIKETVMKRILSLSIAVLMLLTMATVGTSTAAAQTQSVEPSAGPAGTTFTFHVGGFDGSERVAYWLNTPISTILAIGDRGTNASGGKIL